MRLNKELATKILGGVDEGRRFYCHDGKFFCSLGELKDGIKNMSNDIFAHHTGPGRNDFSNWVRECVGDVRLADGLIGLDKESALKKIGARITYIEKYLEKKL